MNFKLKDINNYNFDSSFLSNFGGDCQDLFNSQSMDTLDDSNDDEFDQITL